MANMSLQNPSVFVIYVAFFNQDLQYRFVSNKYSYIMHV